LCCGWDEPQGHTSFGRYQNSNFRAPERALHARTAERAEATLRPESRCVVHEVVSGMNFHHSDACAARIPQGRPEAARVNLGPTH